MLRPQCECMRLCYSCHLPSERHLGRVPPKPNKHITAHSHLILCFQLLILQHVTDFLCPFDQTWTKQSSTCWLRDWSRQHWLVHLTINDLATNYFNNRPLFLVICQGEHFLCHWWQWNKAFGFGTVGGQKRQSEGGLYDIESILCTLSTCHGLND